VPDLLFAVTLRQPWPNVVATGKAPMLLMAWAPHHSFIGRRIAFHASAVVDHRILESVAASLGVSQDELDEPTQALVATAKLERVERVMGEHVNPDSRWRWHLCEPVSLLPGIPCAGAPALWSVAAEHAETVRMAGG
jgi:hypothetical protein